MDTARGRTLFTELRGVNLTYKTKLRIKKTVKAGFYGAAEALRLLLKTVGVLLLILITTGAIFACIFVIFIKTNLVTEDLGVSLEEYQLNETSIIYYYDKTRQEWVESTSIQSEEGYMYWVPYEKIPRDMEHALVAIEDQRFYRHHGVDWIRTASAFVHMFAGMENTFGGSTITQQLRKNVTGENEATIRRKLTEIFAALQMEKEYEKWEIVEWYLNVVNFGHGDSKGIGDAARYYFDKEVENLSLAEMCSIIGITNNPSMYNPYFHPEANKRRQEIILYEMYDQGYISREEYEDACAEELHFIYASTGGDTRAIYSWFDETVRQDAAEFLAEQRGITVTAAKRLLATGGFKIYSTMDPDVQAAVDEIYGSTDFINSLGAKPAKGGPLQLQSSIIVMDPYTGNIVALAGSVGEKRANLLQNMATDTLRPPGSSFKPVASYAPAMDLGLITPDTLFDDAAYVFEDRPNWPYNDDHKIHGIVTIKEAIQESYNRVAVQVLDQLTLEASYDFLTNKLHMNLTYPDDLNYAPLGLGQLTRGVTVREMANAFSIFPNGGLYIESRTFSEIYDSDWNLIYENRSDYEGVISDTTAYWMTELLRNAATKGTGKSANLGTMPTAGKTGTSDDFKDRWFVGFTPYYCAAVWTGYEYPVHITSSGNPACKMWKAVMSQVHENLPKKDFTVPANTYQEPVPGVEPLAYGFRCMTTSGGYSLLLSEEVVGTAAEGRTVTVTAPAIDDYTLVGSATQTVTVTGDEENNYAVFYYTFNAPPPPEDDPGDDPEDDPGEEPGDDPGDDPGEDPGGNMGEDAGGNQGGSPGDDPGENQGEDTGGAPQTGV